MYRNTKPHQMKITLENWFIIIQRIQPTYLTKNLDKCIHDSLKANDLGKGMNWSVLPNLTFG